MIKHFSPIALWLCAVGAQAHTGHGLDNVVHWHADQVLPYVGLSVLALAVGLWLTRRQ